MNLTADGVPPFPTVSGHTLECRATQSGHAVRHPDPDLCLCDLGRQFAAFQVGSGDLFEPADLRLAK